MGGHSTDAAPGAPPGWGVPPSHQHLLPEGSLRRPALLPNPNPKSSPRRWVSLPVLLFSPFPPIPRALGTLAPLHTPPYLQFWSCSVVVAGSGGAPADGSFGVSEVPTAPGMGTRFLQGGLSVGGGRALPQGASRGARWLSVLDNLSWHLNTSKSGVPAFSKAAIKPKGCCKHPGEHAVPRCMWKRGTSIPKPQGIPPQAIHFPHHHIPTKNFWAALWTPNSWQ